MCGQGQSSSISSNTDSTPSYKNTVMRLDDYFFLDPVFIIGMLVLVVIIVIIVSWWLQRRKLAAEENDIEKDETPDLHAVVISEKNLEVLEGLLNTVAIATDNGNETEALFINGERERIGKHTSFGPITKLHDGSNSDSIMDCEKIPKEDSDKIITIIPDKDFRDFPKTEEDQMKMRRANMIQMLALPPLS